MKRVTVNAASEYTVLKITRKGKTCPLWFNFAHQNHDYYADSWEVMYEGSSYEVADNMFRQIQTLLDYKCYGELTDNE